MSATTMDLRTAKIQLAAQIEWGHGELEAYDSASDLFDTLHTLLSNLESLHDAMHAAVQDGAR